jgi:hypothetical protein
MLLKTSIGSQNIKTDDNHPSIKAIKENKTESDQFIFNPIMKM